jgi:hypothetical protein
VFVFGEMRAGFGSFFNPGGGGKGVGHVKLIILFWGWKFIKNRGGDEE